MRWIFSCFAALLVTACVSAEERDARDAATCSGYGFEPGTDAFGMCLMQIDRDRRAAAAASLEGLGDGFNQGVTCQTIGTMTRCY